MSVKQNEMCHGNLDQLEHWLNTTICTNVEVQSGMLNLSQRVRFLEKHVLKKIPEEPVIELKRYYIQQDSNIFIYIGMFPNWSEAAEHVEEKDDLDGPSWIFDEETVKAMIPNIQEALNETKPAL